MHIIPRYIVHVYVHVCLRGIGQTPCSGVEEYIVHVHNITRPTPENCYWTYLLHNSTEPMLNRKHKLMHYIGMYTTCYLYMYTRVGEILYNIYCHRIHLHSKDSVMLIWSVKISVRVQAWATPFIILWINNKHAPLTRLWQTEHKSWQW